jgi:predicted nucleotidyltransferase
MNTDSPSLRLAAVLRHGSQLLRIANEQRAFHLALCGSVARREDRDGSDIDFYVHEFAEPDAADARERANQLVLEFRQVLRPCDVDIRGIPGWPIDPEYAVSMKTDAVDLCDLLSRA